ncbi:MAG: NAD(P)/FAD-dependent oxidoreductase [Candidatus Diapherotrites archaeon]
MKLNCDVLVIGAGPAGLSAARAAALSGAKVICLEKKKKIGEPVKCAEAIGNYLLDKNPFKIPRKYLLWKINGIIFRNSDLTYVGKGPFWEGYSINRIFLERWVYSLAIGAGARILLDSEFISATEKQDGVLVSCRIRGVSRDIFSKKLIAADGVDSNVLKSLNKYKKRKFGTAKICSFEIKSNFIKNRHFEQIFYDYYAPQGYAYIFPKGKNLANIGVGTFKKNVEPYFSEFIEDPLIKPQLKKMEILADKSHLASFENPVNKIAWGNIIGAGDSVNQNLKPFIEGIIPAIICGDIAGKYSVKRLNDSLNRDEYIAEINNVLGSEYDLSNSVMSDMKKIFEKPVKKCANLLFLRIKKIN